MSQTVALLGLELAVWEVAAIVGAAVLGGAAQSALGFGASFTTVPALALLAPRLLPGSIVVAVVPLSITMISTQWSGLDARAVGRITLGRLPGIALGGAVVAVLDVRALTAFIGVLLLAAVAASVSGWELRVTGPREVTAGAFSGLTGTTAGLGGPPLALLYRGEAGDRLRPTLAGVWLVGSVPTVAALVLAGSFTAAQAQAGAVLAAAMVVGLTFAAPAVARMSDNNLRWLVLGWAGFGSVAALARSLLGS